MKNSFRSFMMSGAVLLGLAMCLTSCEGTLDDLFGEWSRPTGQQNNDSQKQSDDPKKDEVTLETPLTLELSAVNGSFYVNFMQFFEGDTYLRAFIRQLRENNINYDVLYQERTKYPGFVCPWR